MFSQPAHLAIIYLQLISSCYCWRELFVRLYAFAKWQVVPWAFFVPCQCSYRSNILCLPLHYAPLISNNTHISSLYLKEQKKKHPLSFYYNTFFLSPNFGWIISEPDHYFMLQGASKDTHLPFSLSSNRTVYRLLDNIRNSYSAHLW